MGRLTRDPEIRYTQNGKACAQFTLAVNRTTKDEEGNYLADFVPIVVWGKTAEFCGNNLGKGRRAIVGGRLQIRDYTDKNGGRHWITEVIAANVEVIDWGDRQPAAAADPGSMESFGKPDPKFDEEIPF